MSNIIARSFHNELNAEYRATRLCLERIPESLYSYKPHPKSMDLGYLTLLVAEIPLWIKHMVIDGVIDFVTFKHASPKTTAEMLNHFEDNMEAARKVLADATDKDLEEPFTLQADGKPFYTAPKKADISTTLNHWVHHRGQLTVYMRLNDILVPSIYGPSADDKNFTAPK